MKSGLGILIRAPEVPYLVPPKPPKRGHFSRFGGTKNGTSGAPIKKFQKTDPPKPATKTPPKKMRKSVWRCDVSLPFWSFWGCQKWHFGCANQNSKTNFIDQISPYKATLGTQSGPRKVIFGHFIDFEYFGSIFGRFYIVKRGKTL